MRYTDESTQNEVEPLTPESEPSPKTDGSPNTKTNGDRRTPLPLIVLASLGIIVLLLLIVHKTGVMGLGQVDTASTSFKDVEVTTVKPEFQELDDGSTTTNIKDSEKNSTNLPLAEVSSKSVDSSSKERAAEPAKDTVPAAGESIYYCHQNSQLPQCCNPEHCKLVVQSTLFSECCKNVVTRAQLPQFLRSINPKKPPPTMPRKLFPILITATPRSGTVFTQTLLKNLGLIVMNDMQTPVVHGMVSWMHIYQDTQYFGPGVVGGSKFDAIWHQVRDPLKSLTSISFTEPLNDWKEKDKPLKDWRDSNSRNRVYVNFLRRHINVTLKEEVEKTVRLQDSRIEKQENATSKAAQLREDILIWRGLEFYLQWHRFIVGLKVPRFQLEDIVERKNMTLLDNIFKSMDQPPPNHRIALRVINAGRRRRQRRRILRRKLHTNSRKHRPTLQWDELCHVAPDKAQQFLELSHEFGYYLDKKLAC